MSEQGIPNPDGFTMSEDRPTPFAEQDIRQALLVAEMVEEEFAEYTDVKSARRFICFVGEKGETKQIHRHTTEANSRFEAAEFVLEHCTLVDQVISPEVEVFVHAGSLFHLELVETDPKP